MLWAWAQCSSGNSTHLCQCSCQGHPPDSTEDRKTSRVPARNKPFRCETTRDRDQNPRLRAAPHIRVRLIERMASRLSEAVELHLRCPDDGSLAPRGGLQWRRVGERCQRSSGRHAPRALARCPKEGTWCTQEPYWGLILFAAGS